MYWLNLLQMYIMSHAHVNYVNVYMNDANVCMSHANVYMSHANVCWTHPVVLTLTHETEVAGAAGTREGVVFGW